MTLNTFHFAGRGEMNVTLGIPRLREILMVASANIKTPSMDIPFFPYVKELEAEKLRLKLTSVTLAQVLQRVEVTESIDADMGYRVYRLKFCFLEGAEYAHKFCVRPSHVLSYFERRFIKSRLLPALRKVSKQKKDGGIDSIKEGRGGGGDDEDDIFGEGRAGGGESPERRDVYEEHEKKGMGEGHESSDEEPEVCKKNISSYLYIKCNF
jgi:DNA-directed RNA polymerase I subunit RPA1